MTTTESKQYVKRNREAHHAALLELARSLNPKTKESGLSLWRKLKRIEDEAHAGATAYCNGETFTEWDRADNIQNQVYCFTHDENAWDTFAAKIERKVAAVLGGVPPRFQVNGDARGYALKLSSSDGGREKATPFNLHSDWGSNQILAPVIE